MTRTTLDGIDGANPLGFLAALGVLRLVTRERKSVRLGFLDDGSFRAFLEGAEAHDVAALIMRDVSVPSPARSWWLEYEKIEKNGVKIVADLKAPPAKFRAYVARCLDAFADGDTEAVAYAAAFATEVAVDGKGNTKPTAFHFTAANQTFLGAIEEIRERITVDWVRESLFVGHAERSGSNVRWDPNAERNRALMAYNPVHLGTAVDAPLEWLAFRALPLLPCVPRGNRVYTTCVAGDRQDELSVRWPLWCESASLTTVKSLLPAFANWGPRERMLRGVFATCVSSIRRSNQGFGNFGPAAVSA